jgi:hypothetical protein
MPIFSARNDEKSDDEAHPIKLVTVLEGSKTKVLTNFIRCLIHCHYSALKFCRFCDDGRAQGEYVASLVS